MNIELRIMTQEEQKYGFSQSQQLMMQCGGIGYLRGDFASSGKEFFTTWFDHNLALSAVTLAVEAGSIIENDHPVQDFTTIHYPQKKKKQEQGYGGPVMGGM